MNERCDVERVMTRCSRYVPLLGLVLRQVHDDVFASRHADGEVGDDARAVFEKLFALDESGSTNFAD